MLLRTAREMYEKQCLDQQYIWSIDSLVKYSRPNLIRRDLDAKIRVFVIVQATVLRLDKYDTITGMHVVRIIPKGKIGPSDLLECANEYYRAILVLDDQMNYFKVGDLIPIKVGETQHKILNDQVFITAYPFAPHQLPQVAYMIPKVSEQMQTHIHESLLPMVEAKQQLLASCDPTRVKYFTQLLYPYKTDQSNSPFGSQIDLNILMSSLGSYEGKYICIDPKINLSNLQVSLLTEAELRDSDIQAMSDGSFTSIIIFAYVKHLNLICELSMLYLDPSTFAQHQYIWDLYEKNRLA